MFQGVQIIYRTCSGRAAIQLSANSVVLEGYIELIDVYLLSRSRILYIGSYLFPIILSALSGIYFSLSLRVKE